MENVPFYDPQKTYEENFASGPFGAFADGKVYEDAGEPVYGFLGQKIYSPFGIANGPLINGKFVKAALDKGFDIVEYKDTRTHKVVCNPWPNIVPLKVDKDLTLEMAEHGLVAAQDYSSPLTITNSFGIPSFDPDFWQPDLSNAVKYAKKGQVVIGGMQGTLPESGGFGAYLKDFILIAKLVKQTGVEIAELNLSCPNEGVNNLLCFDIERSGQVVESVKNEIGNLPLMIKIAYFRERDRLANFVSAVGPLVQAIEAINTIPAKIIDEQGNPALTAGRTTSGTCGAGIKWAGLEMAERLKKLREEKEINFAIIGVGGVMNVNDFNDYRRVGADAVMSATGAMWNPFLAQEIKKQLTIND